MSNSSLMVARLRILRNRRVVYDENFHHGINIIRGENGSGKSTIADAIFFILGGEFDGWKDAARKCDEVEAEIVGLNGTITVRRAITTRLESPLVFHGKIEAAFVAASEEWKRYPIRRVAGQLSYSQVLFRLYGIPEAPNQGSANITSHQVMRLLYADQRTPAPRLFRFEPFDTRDIRLAVGELIVGINGYDLYNLQLQQRALKTELEDKQRDLNSLIKSVPSKNALSSMVDFDILISELVKERHRSLSEIEEVDSLVKSDQTQIFIAGRKALANEISTIKSQLRKAENAADAALLEIAELESFISYLNDLAEKLKLDSGTSELIGSIEFSYCPACLTPLKDHAEQGRCILCEAVVDPGTQKDRFLEISIDTQLQIREALQLLDAQRIIESSSKTQIRQNKSLLNTKTTEFATRYDLSNSPRESFLAERNNKIGKINSDISYLEELRELMQKISDASAVVDKIKTQIEQNSVREKELGLKSRDRMGSAMNLVNNLLKSYLKKDLRRQEEFENPVTTDVNFGDDAVSVNDSMNFAESSNVILKNSAILALFSAATFDERFWHPRFLLLDNVEDKGMEDIRSHNFQKIIVAASKAAKFKHQIIFTTSTICPELEIEDYVIGPKYSRNYHSLRM